MFDWLRLALWGGVGTIILGIAMLVPVTWASTSSRNLVLGFASMIGATTLFVTNLPFEFRRTVTREYFTTELIIDPSAPAIKQSNYPTSTPISKSAIDELA